MVERFPNILASEEKATISMEPTFALAVDIDLQNPGFRLYHALFARLCVCRCACLSACVSCRCPYTCLPLCLLCLSFVLPVLDPRWVRMPVCRSVCLYAVLFLSCSGVSRSVGLSIYIMYAALSVRTCINLHFFPQKNPPDFSCVGCC